MSSDPSHQLRPADHGIAGGAAHAHISFLSGGGEMGALMRAKNWADTPLGPPEAWPQSLKTVIRILLTSRYQMWMGWGPDLSFFYNDAYRPTLGVKHARALGMPAREVWKEIWSDIGPRIEHVLRTGDATWDEALLLFLERSGYPEETYHTFSYSPLANDDGEIVGMLCVVTEETERVIGERRLSSLRELASDIAGKTTRTEVLASAARQVSANLKDLPFTLTYLYEPDGTARLAYATGTNAGDTVAPLTIDPADIDAAWPAGALSLQRRLQVVENVGERFDHVPTGAWSDSPRQAVIAPITRPGHDVLAGFLVAGINPYRGLDATYLGFIELVAGQLAAGLANADAHEEERRRAETLAELDRAKTTFFSNVSHEFRTPLTLMLGPLEDVLARSESAPLAEHRMLIALAHRSGVRLLKLVNTLLDFSRIEAGRVQASFEPVDLVAFTAELASNFRSTIERAGLRLIVENAVLPQPVYVDRDMWEKVILNLLSNAFKYTFDGEIAVEFGLSSDAGSAEVTVRDSGIGISADELPHLFERFRRVESASGRSIEGSGIGLALVQELVKMHGGDIRVASEPGSGSAFTVALPFGTAHLPVERNERRPTPTVSTLRAQAYIDEARGWLSDATGDPADLPAASGSQDIGDVMPVAGAERYRVLLADDNTDMRNYVERLLRSAGFQVEAVADGAAALAAARQRRPDLVLSDIMMPKLDGFGLLTAMRQDPELRPTPVLLLSARAGEEARVEGLSAGADDYLTKPFSARELLARIRANLDLAALRREAVRVERELRQQAELAQERAESILASINDGFMAIDAEWRFTYVNAAAERMIGRTAEGLIGKNHWIEYPDSPSGMIETNYRRAMTERVAVAFENFYAPWRRWFDVRVYPARDGGLSIYFQDITERKQAQEAMQRVNETLEAQVALRTAELQSKEARLRTIFETSFTFQGLMALDGTLIDANAASLAAIDARFEDVVNKPFWDTPWFTGTPGMPEMVRAALPAVAGGEIVRRELYLDLPVGGWRWFDFQMRPVKDRSGAVVGIVPEAVEVTARRQYEEALRQAQKMEGIGQLTGGVAHDFNNLLTIIAGNLETMQRQLKSPAFDVSNVQRLIGNAMRGAERAISLTQRLLAFSRQQPLDAKPIAVGRLITGMSELLRRSIGEQIVVETVIAGGLWQINADAHHLEIAILNLVINARDAMPNGGRITIEAANASLDESYAFANTQVTPGQYVMVAISDNGIGMAAETVARAFEPFFTTKDIGHGTGLGLSQVYGFVKQSGGHVIIYSEAGEGTTVKIYLPRLHAEEVPAPDEPPESIAKSSQNETILLVEDDDEVRAHTGGILRELGYNVVEAPNAKTALEVLARQPGVQLLFTDIGLPGGMNGRQLADAARQQLRNLRVLFTTGYARNAIVHDGRLDPGVELITKPFTYVALSAKLRDILTARAAAPCILVIEDDELIQMVTSDDLAELGYEVQTASSAAEAKQKLQMLNGNVDAAIVDVELPDISGDVLVNELRTLYPSLPIVVASGHDPMTLRSRFRGHDGLGFLGKPYGIQQLQAALHSVGVVEA